MNAYARKHPQSISDEVKPVLPVQPEDALRHLKRFMLTFVSSLGNQRPLLRMNGLPAGGQGGSNTWAIGPSRSASGNALLLQNPHLAWHQPFMRFYEAQLVGPEANVYGSTLIGLPVMAMGFNKRLGWSHTVNTVDAFDTYQLRHTGREYRFDGTMRLFKTGRDTLRVRQPDGSMQTETIRLRRSVHGPVVRSTDSTALAVRAPMLSRHGALRQWRDMGLAKDLSEFESATRRLQIPMFTTSYADRNGHIYYLFGGQVPDRSTGSFTFWQRTLPGDTSSVLWRDVHGYDALPKVVDPDSGFLQNSNSPPWFATLPSPLKQSNYPEYLAPNRLRLREQRGLQMLRADTSISLSELVDMRYSNHLLLADRVLEDLLPAARAAEDALTREAARVLTEWDRTADAKSRGGVLFSFWARAACQGIPANCGFAEPWTANAPISTPSGLASPKKAATILEKVATRMKKRFGRIDVAWGEVMRLSDRHPGNGARGTLGTFHVMTYAPSKSSSSKSKTFRAVHGDTWVSAVEFTNHGPEGKVLLPYGNASQPGSPHDGHQLKLLSRKEMRPLWYTRTEVEDHVENQINISY
jgi:Protein related to penicillin acylase